jgi:ComF family protein
MLHALKYQGRRSIASELSALMRLHGQAVLAGADFVVPVPLHWRRRWRRGFNQAADLARALGLPVRQVLCRCRRTLPQADLPAGQRHLNVRRAFRVRHPSLVANASIVLIDDVRTTGATLEACGRALRGAGAREVRALTAARVVTRPPPARPR